MAYEGDGIVEPGENSDEELRRASQNPMADLISFPVQNNTNFGYGPLDKTQNVTNIQPVVPFRLTDDWLIISRTIAPIIYQPEFVRGQGSEFGLGDITQSLFVGPSSPGAFIWGAGPVFLLPTATDERLGTDKWGVGPAAVGLTVRPPWVFGALVQNIWSFAGDSDRDDVNQMLIQYFINYNLPDGWYLTSSPIITANWEADSDSTWTIPFGGGVGRFFRIGKLPVNMQVQGFYNVEKPDDLGPDWTLRFQIQVLLPKGGN
ncbi:MAG: neuromedin U [Candidatus Hydrogenedentota bacterium]|nr:MAG: neuromedin U [Candidatus Hydrogenedentota bacterium]